jgi:pyruvate ferredoxin oxidoreductase alpha subunit
MKASKEVILEVGKDFGEKFGRSYEFMEGYKLDDAEVAIVALGSTCGTAKVAIDELRKEGIKAGLLKLRVFRPFPAEEIVKALSKVKNIAILDRSDSYNTQGGPLYTEIRSAMYDLQSKPKLVNYVYGLGGRDINVSQIKDIYKAVNQGNVPQFNYLGVRE